MTARIQTLLLLTLLVAISVAVKSGLAAASEPAFVGRNLNFGVAFLLLVTGALGALAGYGFRRKATTKMLGNVLLAIALATTLGASSGWGWRAMQPHYHEP